MKKSEIRKILYIIKHNKTHHIKEIKNKFPNIFKKIKNLKIKGFLSIQECMYAAIKHLNYRPICRGCGKKVNFWGISDGFSEFCSNICAQNSFVVKNRIKRTFNKKYGVNNPTQNYKIKKKIENTNLIRYGSKCVFASNKIKKKIAKTNRVRYGTDNPFGSRKIRKKIKNTNLKKYNCENPFGSKIIQRKIRKTWKEKYGVSNPNKCKQIRKKIYNTNMNKYGYSAPAKSNKVKRKIEKTNITKYGVKYTQQNKKIKNKSIKTNIKRYGGRSPVACPKIFFKLQKSSFKLKTVKRKNKIFKYRGYEKFAIDYLLKIGVRANSIKFLGDVKSFKYKIKGIDHTYYPDLFYIKRNKKWIVEVKSLYTLGFENRKLFNVNVKKAKAAMKKGYSFVFLIFKKDGSLLLKKKNPRNWKYSEMKSKIRLKLRG